MQRAWGEKAFLQNPPAINIGGQQSNAEFQYIVQGADVPLLYQAATELEQRLHDVKIIQDVNSNLELRNPEIQLNILRDHAAVLGITPQQIQSTLYNAYGGRRITNIYGASDQYSVIMQVDKAFEADINSLNALYIKSANNQMTPLVNVASAGSAACGSVLVRWTVPV